MARALASLDPRASDARGERLDALRQALTGLAQRGDASAASLLQRLGDLRVNPSTASGLAAALPEAQDGALVRQILLLSSVAAAGAESSAGAAAAVAERLAELQLPALGTAAIEAAARGASREALGRVPELLRAGAAQHVVADSVAMLFDRASSQGSESSAAQGDARLTGAALRAILSAGVAGEPAALGHAVIELAAAMGEGLPEESRLLLLAAHSEGAVRDALERHLGASEFERAWASARREAGDVPQWTFAVPDGPTGHTTLHLRSGDDASEQGGEDREAPTRLTVGVDFSALGPVRADFVLRDDQVALRIVAADAETARVIRQRALQLEALLGGEGRRVLLAVADGTVAAATVDQGAAAAPSLSDGGSGSTRAHEHRPALMDLEG